MQCRRRQVTPSRDEAGYLGVRRTGGDDSMRSGVEGSGEGKHSTLSRLDYLKRERETTVVDRVSCHLSEQS